MGSDATSPWAADGDVTVDHRGDGVATLTLARPPGNGWTPALGRIFYARLDELADDPSVRAVVITGAGPDFCVGGDANRLDQLAEAGSYTPDPARPQYSMPVTIGKPIIAAVNGACFGFGMQLALYCDVRFAGLSAKFSTAFVRRGLIGELGMTWLLPRIVGLGTANDLLLSGRLVRAAEAEHLRLVNRVVADDELLGEATRYAAQLAATGSPAAMAVIKRQTYLDLTSQLTEAVRRADRHMVGALASSDFAEGVRSWREGRAPVFDTLPPDRARFTLPGDDHAVSDDPAGLVEVAR